MTRPSHSLKGHPEGKVVLIDWGTIKLSKLLEMKTNFADGVLSQSRSFRKLERFSFEGVEGVEGIESIEGISPELSSEWEKNLTIA